MKKFSLLLAAAVLLLVSALPGRAAEAAAIYVAGTLTKVDNAKKIITVTLPDKNQTKKTYTVGKNTRMTINSLPVTLEAFKPGLKITATLTNKQLTFLKGWSIKESQKGAIAPEAKMTSGTVSQVEGSRIWVKPDNDYGEVKPFTVTNATAVMKNGVKRDLRALLEGDKVKMYFNSVSTSTVAKLEIQDDSVQVNAIYKGKLQRYDQRTGNLYMTGVQICKDAKWQPYKALYTIHIEGSLYPVYAGDRKLDLADLAQYKESNMIVATKMFLSREQAERIIIERRNERTYSEPIESYNMNTKEIELEGNHTFQIHAGTMLIRNGRLVDKFGLTGATHAFVSADAGYQAAPLSANLVYVYNEGIEKKQLDRDGIYWGTLDTILNGKLWLKDYFALSGHQWEFQQDGQRQLFYDNESVLLDMTNGISINPNEFDRKNYAVDESDPYAIYHGLKDWFGYVYAADDRIVEIGIWRYPDQLPAHVVSIGIADKLAGSLLTIKDLKDWSASRTDWIPSGSSITVDLSKAVIMKDGATAQLSDIEPNNNVYVIHEGSRALVAIIT